MNLEMILRRTGGDPDKCIWHKSQSLSKNNAYYVSCHQTCKGYNEGCGMYTPRYNFPSLLKKKDDDDELMFV